MADQDTYLAVLKASYDYDPQPDADEELAVKEGQILLLLERVDDDWWKVKLKLESQDEDGPSGLVPAAYVEPAEHISTVKVLYDYEATQSTELNVKEDDLLYVYDKDDAWLLVQKQSDDSQVGYVPGNYVEESQTSEEDTVESAVPTPSAVSQIVVPDSPPRPARPVSTYVDPAERVAAAKAQADDIKTWTISEVDKKGKKKKGTLGVGNGAVFFASESDKTPVQKWQTSDIQDVRLEKSKHVHIEIGGSEPISLHFHAGAKDVAEAIIAKLESSRSLSGPGLAAPAAMTQVDEPVPRRSSPPKAVHFDSAEPEIIPPREAEDEGLEEEPEPEGEAAVALYDFSADGEDELTVQEGEPLLVLERDGDEWWKCRNTAGGEGVVPASYIELVNGATAGNHVGGDEDAAAATAARAAREAEEQAEAERLEREHERAERERTERERKKAESEQRAKAAAVAAEADRKRREKERARQQEEAREAENRRKEQRESTNRSPEPSRTKKTSVDQGRTSTDRRGPPRESTRVWHDRSGQFRVEAAFLGFNNGKLRLHKVNGVVIEVPSEKMSAEDMRYIEKLTKKSSPSRKSDDDEPLELRRRSLQPESARPSAPSAKKKSTTDWFDFFLNAGCDVDDCTRYASAFERDKIDETILPDITESTMRSLGLREGDIIRVKKAIEQRQPKPASDSALRDQMLRDEELARQLQAEENGGKPRSQPPNLFAAGPNGALKNASMRRGRPQPSKSMPPSSVDLQSITSASGQIQRTDSPTVASPDVTTPPSATSVQPPSRSNSAVPTASGFDDDAWTNRPSSTKPIAPTPPAVAPRAPSAPPAPPPAPTPPAAQASAPVPTIAAAPPSAPATPATHTQPQTTGSTLAKTNDDIFDQLARLTQLRTQSPAIQVPQRAPSVPIATPLSYQSGLGMGSSPVPIGQHIQHQQTGLLPPPQPPQPVNGPRGPLAPVPANQSLLQPLIPTNTGFNSFVSTRPQSAQSPFQSQAPQPSFLSTQPTGFPGANQLLLPQSTGFPGAVPSPIMAQPTGFNGGNFSAGPMMSQPTGMPGINYGGQMGQMNGGFTPTPSFQNGGGFGVQSNPTGYTSGFGQSPFGNGASSPPAPPAQPAINTSPANIFAQMKSGTFASDNTSVPQSADKYDALRPAPSPLTAQPTGWGYQGMNVNGGAFTGGYGYQH